MIKNKYKIVDNIVTIYLKRRTGEVFETIIDKEDFEKVNQYNVSWHVRYAKSNNSYYAKSGIYIGCDENSRSKYISLYMHRTVMDAKDGDIVDHINHNTLDNRKCNLRIIIKDDNDKNRKSKNSNNTSGYRNVSWINSIKRWCVQLQIDGKNTILGKFKDVHEAGGYAELMRQKYYGKYAGQN